jgi:type VI secretion system protein ImpJ
MYSVLRQVIGELSSFSGNISVNGEQEHGTPLLLGYDHQNLWECFSGAKLLITRLLDEITAGPEYIIQLLYDGTYFSAELPPTIFEGRNQFFLVFETETDPKNVLQTMGKIAKLSSRQTLPILIARSLSGIKLDHLAIPPQELPRRAHSIYFQIDHHSDQWDQVQKGNNLALYWDAAPQDLKAELMVVRRT